MTRNGCPLEDATFCPNFDAPISSNDQKGEPRHKGGNQMADALFQP
jgi:hypothetical protein